MSGLSPITASKIQVLSHIGGQIGFQSPPATYGGTDAGTGLGNPSQSVANKKENPLSPENAAKLFKYLRENVGNIGRVILLALPSILIVSLYGGELRNALSSKEKFKGPAQMGAGIRETGRGAWNLTKGTLITGRDIITAPFRWIGNLGGPNAASQ
ncbi:MAG: hypothetical protein QNJ31_08940 [Candidatus Caenarcaniphilales bacterium]|nr:hypothetical protein [Candidatus Caenarcaniphilales bacterium]